jgi:biopolymer transport protein ExbD
MKRKLRGSGDEADIDMTPMLDVTFIMLIFFIVTTSFAKEFGIDVNRPTSSNQQTVKSSLVIGIELKENGEIVMENRIVDAAAVRANVERMRAAKPDAAVIIAVARGATTGMLVRVIDQAREAGAQNISVAATSN